VSLVKKLFRTGFALWFALTQVMFGTSAAFAQSGLIDVEPPLIEHEIISEVEADTRQTFFATVVDDDELDSVSLYYRFSGDPTYSVVLMNRVSYSSTYIVHLPTDSASDRNIEYYIQARDKAGNRTVRGYAFNPLVRNITAENAEPDAATSENTKAAETAASSNKNRTALYIVLGTLALGLLAGSLGKPGGGGGSAEPCPNGICTISVTVGPP